MEMNWDQKREQYGQYRKTKIETGLLYQDFVVDCCWSILGLAVVQYTSRAYQITVGESRTGVEIKHDQKFATTGNLWIELAEKAQPRPGPYASSGIDRADNSWLYIIGDYDTIFIFAKRWLQALARSGHYRQLENNTKTSIGFLLPQKDAIRYAAQVLYPNASAKIGKHIQDLLVLGKELHAAIIRPVDSAQLQLFQD